MYVLPFPSHSQFVQAGVKLAALVSTTGREEQARSLFAIVRSYTVEDFNTIAKNNIYHAPGNEKKSIHPRGESKGKLFLVV